MKVRVKVFTNSWHKQKPFKRYGWYVLMFINHLEYLKTLLSEPGVLFASSVNGITQPTLAKISFLIFLLIFFQILQSTLLTALWILLLRCSSSSLKWFKDTQASQVEFLVTSCHRLTDWIHQIGSLPVQCQWLAPAALAQNLHFRRQLKLHSSDQHHPSRCLVAATMKAMINWLDTVRWTANFSLITS